MATTVIKSRGKLIGSFEVLGLPSVNVFYNKHYKTRATWTKRLRELGRDKGEELVGFRDTPLVKRALVVVRVWIPRTGVMDIHNDHIKPILDGLTDAGVWVDDEWAFVPAVLFVLGGVGTALEELKRGRKKRSRTRKSVIEIYELADLEIGGTEVSLPKGRRYV